MMEVEQILRNTDDKRHIERSSRNKRHKSVFSNDTAIFKVNTIINKTANNKLGETFNQNLFRGGGSIKSQEKLISPTNLKIKSHQGSFKKSLIESNQKIKEKGVSIQILESKDDRKFDLDKLANLYIKPNQRNSMNPKLKLSTNIGKKSQIQNVLQGEKPSMDKLSELNQLYKANVQITKNSKRGERRHSDQILPPVLKTESSLTNTHNNSNFTNSTRGLTPTKRDSKSNTISQVENLLSRDSSVNTLLKKSIQENINISQLPELMNNIMNKGKDPTKNIINIVNNMNPTNDKKIAFKVNVNQYDIKYYATKKKKDETYVTDNDHITDNKTNSELDLTDPNEESKLIEISKAKEKKKDNLNSFYSILREEIQKQGRKDDPKYKIQSQNNIPNIRIKFEEKKNNLQNKIDNENIINDFVNDNSLHENTENIESNINDNEEINAKENDDNNSYKLNIITEEESMINKTGTFVSINDKLYKRNNSLAQNSNNVFPKFNLQRNMSLKVDKLKNIQFLNNSIKSKENGSSINNTEETFSQHQQIFRRGKSQVISETHTSDIGDITFNINNNLNILKNKDKDIQSLNSSQTNPIKSKSSNMDVLTFKHMGSFNSSKKEENVNSELEKSEFPLMRIKTTTEEVEEMENDFSKNTSSDNCQILEEDKINKEEEVILDQNKNLIKTKPRSQSISEKDNNIIKEFSNKSISYLKLNKNFKNEIEQNEFKNTNLFSKRNSVPIKQFEIESVLEEIRNLKENLLIKSKESDEEYLKENIEILNSSMSSDTEENLNKLENIEVNQTKLSLKEIRNVLFARKENLNSLAIDAKEDLIIMSNRYINKIIKENINEKLSQIKNSKVIQFFKEGLKFQMNKLLLDDEETTDIMNPYENIYSPISIPLFQNFNNFLTNKYFDLFKELLIETFAREKNSSEENEGKSGKSVLENFIIDHNLNMDFHKFIPNKMNSLIMKTNGSGKEMIRYLGLENHLHINNFIMRDCTNIFQEEIVKDILADKDDSKDEDILGKFAKRRKTQTFLKRKSDIQLLISIRGDNKKNPLFFLNNLNNETSNQKPQKKNTRFKINLDNDVDDSLDNDISIRKDNTKLLKIPEPHFKLKQKKDFKKIDNLDKLMEFTLLDNDHFMRERNAVKIIPKNKIKGEYEDELEIYFQESSYLPMTKENTLYRTHEIKSNILHILRSPPEMLSFYIRDVNFPKFKEVFEKSRVNVDTTDADGNSLLTMSVLSESYEIAKYLLNLGADVNLQNIHMNSSLHYALSHKNFKMANLLISKKADENLVNIKGLTPWQCLGLDTKEVDKI